MPHVALKGPIRGPQKRVGVHKVPVPANMIPGPDDFDRVLTVELEQGWRVYSLPLVSKVTSKSAGTKTNTAINTGIDRRPGRGGTEKPKEKITSLPAHIPGNIYSDLLASHKIKDPYYDSFQQAQRWVDSVDWVYETSFVVDKTTVTNKTMAELVLDGLDTYAKVYLNDSLIHRGSNMFMGGSVAIDLKEGKNNLKIIFETNQPGSSAHPSDSLRGSSDSVTRLLTGYGPLPARKAFYRSGFTAGPSMLGPGIWRPIYLRLWNKARISGHHFRQFYLTKDLAELGEDVTLSIRDSGTYHLMIRSRKANIASQKTLHIPPGPITIPFRFAVEQPKRWWPNGMGKADLYDFTILLTDAENHPFDSVSYKSGLRTVELVSKADSLGRSVGFKVNGIEVFIKGADYLPQDYLFDRVNRTSYQALMRSVKASNMNMLRMWGGGMYENRTFYDLADESGILIWQQFMLGAPASAPESVPTFPPLAEVQYVVQSLRDHPCIALWDGPEDLGVLKPRNISDPRNKPDPRQDQVAQPTHPNPAAMTTEVIPPYTPTKTQWNQMTQEIQKLDSGRAYFSSLNGHLSPGEDRPERKYLPLAVYWPHLLNDQQNGMTVSRMETNAGPAAFADMQSIVSFIPLVDQKLGSKSLNSHNTTGYGDSILLAKIKDGYRPPATFPLLVYTSQIIQADEVKRTAEEHRRSRPHCMGTIYQQLNDSWPAFSPSGIDYYGRWKAAQYCLKRAYSSVLVSPVRIQQAVRIFIISDLINEVNVNLHVQLFTFDGFRLIDKKFNVLVYPNTSKPYYFFNLPEVMHGLDSTKAYLHVSLERNGVELSANNLYFCPPKAIAFQPPNVSVKIQKAGRYFWLTLQAQNLARSIYLHTRSTESIFSDNYFDLIPGERKVILVKPVKPLSNLNKDLAITLLGQP